METHRNLYPLIYAFNNLYLAYVKARRGKRYQPEVVRFGADLERELMQLYRELAYRTYRTGKYRTFVIYEPKRREVAALPFRDRVVHHAVCNVIEPIFERGFIYHSYACRVGKGTHAGADYVTECLRRVHRRHGGVYVLKADIASYFPSVDHGILVGILGRKIRCGPTMELLEEIVGSAGCDGRGIPIGNLTSQLFANIYLNELDQFVKHSLRVKHYIRYMDDFVMFHHDKGMLWEWRDRVSEFLWTGLRLELNDRTDIFPASRGVDFLGYRIWRTHRLLRKGSVKRMRRKLRRLQRKYVRGEVGLGEIDAVVQSWVGHAMHADTYNLRRKLFSEFRL